jgi:hypothetical protein
MIVFVCVCVREREREGQTLRESARITTSAQHQSTLEGTHMCGSHSNMPWCCALVVHVSLPNSKKRLRA